MLALVKAFLKAGVMTELGDHEDTSTGTPQGGILSPLLANIALHALDEHVHGPWQPGHMSDGFDFVGFHIQWRRKRGTTKWYVYTFIADRPIRSLKDKVRALTSRLSQQPPRNVLIRLNQIMRGWSAYFRHAVAKHTMSSLENFVWHRVIRWMRRLHRWNWHDVRRHHTGQNGRWTRPAADGIELFNLAKVPITRYRYRGTQIPNPWTLANHA